MNAKITAAKVDAVLDPNLCFFGALLCNLKFREDTTCETAWTDGTTLGYNPAYIDSLPHAQVIGLLAHEVMHCAGAHPYRRDNRDPKKWNVACDMAINPVLRDSGITLPEGGLDVSDPAWRGKSAEWIYDRLPDMPNGGNGGSGGSGSGNEQDKSRGNGVPGTGEVRDAPSGGEEPDKLNEGDWEELSRQAAAQAKSRGTLPAGLDRFSKAVTDSKVDWRQVLRKFVQQNAKSDYTWTRPSVRFASQGIYLPSLRSEDMPRVAIAIDTSGSMDDIALAAGKAEVLAVMAEVNPVAIDVFYADARVARHDTFERGEEVIWSPAGGGGTSFEPTFEAIAEMEEAPCCVIYITDLCGSFPDTAPELPVLWVTDTDYVAPFGDTIKM